MLNIDDIKSIPTLSRMLNEGYILASIHPYDTLAAEIIYWRLRLEHPTKGKIIRPIYRAVGGAIKVGEPETAKNGLKPLYGLSLLSRNPKSHVWIVEGEKCADALNTLFSKLGITTLHVAMTSGSAASADKADWQPLEGRDVTIWPDHDQSGVSYAEKARNQLESIGCAVQCIAVDLLGLSEGEDCIEWLNIHPEAVLNNLLELPKVIPRYEMEIVCLSDIEMKPINWLWRDYIACGKLTVIAGNPGLGKSQLTANFGALVSKGMGWPDTQEPAPIGNVLFLSAEDDPADTIKPRLLAAGADIERCYILEAVRIKNKHGKDTTRSFDLSQDIQRMADAIRRIGGVNLAIIDPISAYLGETDSHNNADIRGLLAPLSAMAAECGVAILLITHLNKSENQEMIGRVMGSMGLIAAARAGYVVIKDPNDSTIRHFVPIKNNIGNDAEGFSFTIEAVEVENSIHTSRIVWQEGQVNAQEISHPKPDEKSTATNPAQKFLEDLLTIKPMLGSEIQKEADEAGFSKSSIQRAANALYVQRKKLGMQGGWEWSLMKQYIPFSKTKDAEDTEDSALNETSSPELEDIPF